MKRFLLMSIVSLLLTLNLMAVPKIITYNSSGQSLLAMSDNGNWGLLFISDSDNKSARLVNLFTKEMVDLQTEEEMKRDGRGIVSDISDDGNTIVGAIKGYPAFYNCKEKTWTTLPCNDMSGQCMAVTPDGRYAVGSINDGPKELGEELAWYSSERAVMWDLSTAKVIEIPEHLFPKTDPMGEEIAYYRFVAVSPDGRFLVVRTLKYAECFTLLVDREKETSIFLGFESNDGGKTYLPTIENLYFNEPGGMSTNGRWVVCNGYFVEHLAGGYTNEYSAPIKYNIETGEFVAYNQSIDDHDKISFCIDNSGNVYAASPSGNPCREFYIRNGKYWYALRSVLLRKYGINFFTETALDNTGTPMMVSNDGRTFICMVDPQYGENYCLQTDESLAEICNGMNLLDYYYISPMSGAQMSKAKEFRLTFDREIEVVGEKTAATIGTRNSADIFVDTEDSKTVVIVFRTTTLNDGEKYTLTIPAGVICVKGDKTKTNEEITVQYIGRADVPVVPSTIYPADGSALAKLDYNSSPLILQYPFVVNVTDKASAALFTEEGNKVCNLSVMTTGNTVYISPANVQYLFADINYKVVIEAGSITDVSGSGGNEKLTIHYVGSYEREISHDEMVLFKDDFSSPAISVATWLLYDNDHRQPVAAMEEMEYDADNTPWNFSIRESTESSDFCAGSHSMYNPAGKSDDWMVIPQIFIPDTLCVLNFDAQSFLKNKKDFLRVLVWECDAVLNYIDEETFAIMSEEAEVVLNVELNPGRSEDNLNGDWQSFSVDLKKYVDKNIYIAFVNQNDDQSMVFVDNVVVNRNMKYLLSLKNKQSVIGEESVVIAGTITAKSENETYTGLKMTLRDGEGTELSVIDKQELSLSNGDSYSFSFDTPLPLVIGLRNDFSIDIELGEISETISSYVNDLVFQPTKRVVLEEMTGITCGNCPQGIIVIDYLRSLYGEQFIPISLHTYDGDAWGAGLSSYTDALGMRAAPSAIVNRSSIIIFPMTTDDETGSLTMSYNGELWLDVVTEEMNEETELDVVAEFVYNEKDGTFSVPVTIRNAMNANNQNYNVFVVLMEDKLEERQLNYFSSTSDPLLGEWGLGGIYGNSLATGVIHNDVVRACYGVNVYGTSGLLPQNLTAGEAYSTNEFSDLVIPGTVENIKNAKVAAIIIDANTDKIVNACVAYFGKTNSIDDIQNDRMSDIQYNLAGQRVDGNFKGITIKNKKICIHY